MCACSVWPGGCLKSRSWNATNIIIGHLKCNSTAFDNSHLFLMLSSVMFSKTLFFSNEAAIVESFSLWNNSHHIPTDSNKRRVRPEASWVEHCSQESFSAFAPWTPREASKAIWQQYHHCESSSSSSWSPLSSSSPTWLCMYAGGPSLSLLIQPNCGITNIHSARIFILILMNKMKQFLFAVLIKRVWKIIWFHEMFNPVFPPTLPPPLSSHLKAPVSPSGRPCQVSG